ncbi:separin-like [Homarus americanus]|uniref:separase n=1 Tax=Homarus americanus TaxID=6706 RepID=A0A8J5N486_HOMAM|nr:separin-like [Homarus americanus]
MNSPRRTVESLTNDILAKMGALSLMELAQTSPSVLTTDIHIGAAKEALEAGKMEDAFHQLSLSHSTQINHRMDQLLCKSSRRTKDVEADKIIMATTDKDETINLLQKLPPEWTVIQLTKQSIGEFNFLDINTHPPTPGLFLSRCSCGPKPIVTVQAIAAPSAEGVRGFGQELELIKMENRGMNKDCRNDPEKYFNKREEVNNRLKCLVRSMEVSWLRHWCCMLPGSLDARYQHLLEQTTARILTNSEILLTSSQKQLLQCIISCPLPTEKLKGNEQVTPINMRASVAALLQESVRSQRVKDLYAVIQREERTLDRIRRAPRNPVILILDRTIVSLPWEMMWVLRDQPVTRMPNLRMLTLLYQHHSLQSSSVLVQGVDPSKGFYVLDPDDNLPRYIGHGSGSQYLPGELIEVVECRGIDILYGCSSVSLISRGRVPEPWGVVLNYLLANCPCVVGMLWDVTDKDTDNLTRGMIQALRGQKGESGSPLANPPSDIALLVARSRSFCLWYINAAALAVYGLPLHIVNKSSD